MTTELNSTTQKIEAERKAKPATDKEKIVAFVQMLAAIELPQIENEDTANLLAFIHSEFFCKAISKFREVAREL